MREEHQTIGRNYVGNHPSLRLIEAKAHRYASVVQALRLRKNISQRNHGLIRVVMLDQQPWSLADGLPSRMNNLFALFAGQRARIHSKEGSCPAS